jgi:APA family basic amino acid/polyamine antiporter
MNSIHFEKKKLSDFDSSENSNSLKRTLSGFQLILLGVGAIIGAGIFVLTGQAAAQYAGPAITISFLLSGLACVFAGLCYAELASMIPVAGSAYTYAYASFGRIVAWIIGWDLILEYLFGASTVAVGWSGYVVSFLRDRGIIVPEYLASSPLSFVPGQGWAPTGAYFNLPAAAIILVLTYLLARGIQESSRVNTIIVAIKVTVLTLFIVFGISYLTPENITPYIPENTGEFGKYGFSGILRGAAVVFFAFIGFDCVATLAQEAKNPRKDIPIGILGSLGISTLFYVAVAFVLTGMVHYSKLSVPDPIAVAVDHVGEQLFWLRKYVKVGAIAGLTSCMLVLLMSQARILYAMAHDKLLPDAFGRVNPKSQSPVFSTLLSGIVAAIVAGLFPIGLLGELVSIGTLFAFVIVSVGVLVLRYTNPNAQRVFKTPYVWFVSIIGALASIVQMVALPFDTWIRLIIWMILGMIIYFVYSVRKITSNIK